MTMERSSAGPDSTTEATPGSFSTTLTRTTTVHIPIPFTGDISE